MTDDGNVGATPEDGAAAGGDRPDRPGGKAALIEALNVRQNAVRGFTAGVVFTLAVFVFFVVVPGVSRSPVYYVALAFVLATGIGALVTVALTLADTYRLAKTL